MPDFYEKKLVDSGLAAGDSIVMGFLDAELEWNRMDKSWQILEKVFNSLNINSLIFARPAEPYDSIISYLAEESKGPIKPQDCETRTFLHDLPVADNFSPEAIVSQLRKRKCVIIPGRGIVSFGTISMEQAFVTFSSVCFACFVKFFADFLEKVRNKQANKKDTRVFEKIIALLEPEPEFVPRLATGPLQKVPALVNAMDEAGSLLVKTRLVDSYFGNISCRLGDTLYISQTGASLDNLKGCIDPCPLDNSSCAGITASSELLAHMEIIKKTGAATILHGHPRFSVIVSMDCELADCENRGKCFKKCPRERSVCGIPIVPGEVGTGSNGLCNTVPRAIQKNPIVLVLGHGLFALGKTDFNEPFRLILEAEQNSRRSYFKRIDSLLSKINYQR